MTIRAAKGFAIQDLCVASMLFALTMGMFGPALGRAREQSDRVKCASNLKQIGLAMIMYANNETQNGQSYPRTYYEPGAPLTGTDAGSNTPSPGYKQKDSFAGADKGSPVGINNVMASFFLIAKTQDLAPAVFNCPTTDATPDPFNGSPPGPAGYSCWDVPPNRYLSYSMQVPFPSTAAIKSGFKWTVTLASDFAIAADINPGTPALLSVTPASSVAQMRKANSFNHGGDGQNVLYGDGHVDWMTSPFAGPVRGPATAAYNDNIYTYGDRLSGPTGIIGPPQDKDDNILLPVAGANALMGGSSVANGNPMMRALITLGVAIILIAIIVVAIVFMTRRKKRLPPPLPDL